MVLFLYINLTAIRLVRTSYYCFLVLIVGIICSYSLPARQATLLPTSYGVEQEEGYFWSVDRGTSINFLYDVGRSEVEEKREKDPYKHDFSSAASVCARSFTDNSANQFHNYSLSTARITARKLYLVLHEWKLNC